MTLRTFIQVLLFAFAWHFFRRRPVGRFRARFVSCSQPVHPQFGYAVITKL